MRNVPISISPFPRKLLVATLAARERHDARRRRPARVPHFDQRGLAIAAIGAAKPRAGGQVELGDLLLRLVTAPAAFEEDRGGVLPHAGSLAADWPSTANANRDYCMPVRRRLRASAPPASWA